LNRQTHAPTQPEQFNTMVRSLISDADLLPIFPERFFRATELFDELVTAACWAIRERLGAEVLLAQYLPERCRAPLAFVLDKLALAGSVPGEVADLSEELVERFPGAAVGAEIIALLVDEAPAFFAGNKTGEEILFSQDRAPLWFRYFSNENLLYATNNHLGSAALARVVPQRGEILEVGGGLGSAAVSALGRLGDRVARYQFTEMAPSFLQRGEQAVRAAAPARTAVDAHGLDMTAPWAGQGVPAGSVDTIYSVNCFHVAPDLDAVLGQAWAALRPGGAVVVSECVRPTGRTGPLYPEFIFNFLESFTNVTLHPVRRPNHGFLTPTAWRASFEAAGFTDVQVLPDVDAAATIYPNFIAGAITARKPG
jgi:SAM-dependent methyltransferase